jgi:hypothetical protein
MAARSAEPLAGEWVNGRPDAAKPLTNGRGAKLMLIAINLLFIIPPIDYGALASTFYNLNLPILSPLLRFVKL